MKTILLQIHKILATLVMSSNNYSTELVDCVNDLLEMIYKLSEK